MKKVSANSEILEAIKSSDKVIVKFGADWCSPCKVVDAALEEVHAEGDIQIVKINIDECPDLAGEYGVMSIPTSFFYQDGEFIERANGIMSKDEISKKFMKKLDELI